MPWIGEIRVMNPGQFAAEVLRSAPSSFFSGLRISDWLNH